MEPEERLDLIGHADVDAQLARELAAGTPPQALLIAGPPGIGKATLAFRYARAALAPKARLRPDALAVSEDAPIVRQIANGAHPDLLVLRRPVDEKTGRTRQEIPVDSARNAGRFFTRTAGAGGLRLCIVDKADELNVAAANALLKSLEEPPAGAGFLLLADAPSRVLPTVRSRCRTIALRPVADADIADFVMRDADIARPEAEKIAALAGGRPGRALELLEEEGAAAASLVDGFIVAAAKGARSGAVAAGDALAGVKNDALWASFRAILLDRLSAAARAAARGEAKGDLAPYEAGALVDAWEKSRDWLGRGEGLNLDRSQLLIALAADLRIALRGRE